MSPSRDQIVDEYAVQLFGCGEALLKIGVPVFMQIRRSPDGTTYYTIGPALNGVEFRSQDEPVQSVGSQDESLPVRAPVESAQTHDPQVPVRESLLRRVVKKVGSVELTEGIKGLFRAPIDAFVKRVLEPLPDFSDVVSKVSWLVSAVRAVVKHFLS